MVKHNWTKHPLSVLKNKILKRTAALNPKLFAAEDVM